MARNLDDAWNNLGSSSNAGFSEEVELQRLRAMVDRNTEIALGTKKKDHSVLKGAVVGGILAGPAGAIVGSIYQADKNNRKK